jgi:hypothetical protein
MRERLRKRLRKRSKLSKEEVKNGRLKPIDM